MTLKLSTKTINGITVLNKIDTEVPTYAINEGKHNVLI